MKKIITIVVIALAAVGLGYGIGEYENYQTEQRNQEIMVVTKDNHVIWTTVGAAETVYDLNLDEESWEFNDWSAE